MIAWLLPKLGSIDSLVRADVPDPLPRPGHLILNVTLAALNPADRYLAEGQYPARPPLPHVLGRDGCGVIRSVAPDVTTFRPGQFVMIQRGEAGVETWGTLATQVSVRADSVTLPPPDWTPEQAAGASLVYVTALQALTQFPDLPHPARLLITGASGGVGVAAIQLAKSLGHHVAALSRGTRKQSDLKNLGADLTLDATDPLWRRTLLNHWPNRIDLAIDLIGGAQFNDLIASLADNGRISLVGRLAGPVPNFNTASLFFRRLQLRGVAIAHYTPADTQSAWQQIVQLLKKQNARPLVDSIFNFTDVPAAFARLKEGPLGKVLVRVSPNE